MKRLLLALAVIPALAACGGNTGPFQAAGESPPTCMRHQRNTPSASYAKDTAHGLAVLRYYTANGRRGYCDHKAPTAADRAWAHLYLELGADPQAVQPILNPVR
jgi:hypothetical protein